MADAARTSSGSPIPGSPRSVSKTAPTSCSRTRSWSVSGFASIARDGRFTSFGTRGPDGVSKQVSIGSHVEITAERARQQARIIIDRIKRGLCRTNRRGDPPVLRHCGGNLV